MKNIAVVGTGLQGTAVAFALCKLGYTVELVEPMETVLNVASQKLRLLGCDIFAKHRCYKELDKDNIGVLVSCAPFKMTEAIHCWCYTNGVKYCDLGGNPDVSKAINNNASANKCQTFTDLGLAPGLANIISERLFFRPPVYEDRTLKIDSISVYVGGLPVHPDALGSLKYGRTFNIGGLTNEYSGYDDIIVDGKITKVKTLGGIENFAIGADALEAFYTKGGLGLSVRRLLDKCLLNYCYKTIRYQGHVSLLKFLLEECCLSESEFDKAMINATPAITEDKVYVFIKHMSKCGTVGCSLTQVNSDKNWTAMQKSTAFPTAVIAGMMLENKFKKEIVLNYSHLSGGLFYEFIEKLNNLDVKINDPSQA